MMNLPARPVSAELSVAPQLTPEAMALAAEAGFRSVINNRPDFEGGPDQPTHAQMEAAARDAGLHYAFLPVAPNHQTPEEATRFAELLRTLPAPVLAFCRSGNRSTKLYLLSQQL